MKILKLLALSLLTAVSPALLAEGYGSGPAADKQGKEKTEQSAIGSEARVFAQNDLVTICYFGVTQTVREKIARRYVRLGATYGACGSASSPSILPTTPKTDTYSLKRINPVAVNRPDEKRE